MGPLLHYSLLSSQLRATDSSWFSFLLFFRFKLVVFYVSKQYTDIDRSIDVY